MSPQMKNAKKALKNKQFDAAVEFYEEHLMLYPNDNHARLEYGISNFLAGNEEKFLEIHSELDVKVEKGIFTPNKTLWNMCKNFFSSLIKGAAIAGFVAIPLMSACKDKSEQKTSSTTSDKSTPMKSTTNKTNKDAPKTSPDKLKSDQNPSKTSVDSKDSNKSQKTQTNTSNQNQNNAKPPNTGVTNTRKAPNKIPAKTVKTPQNNAKTDKPKNNKPQMDTKYKIARPSKPRPRLRYGLVRPRSGKFQLKKIKKSK